MNGLKGPFRRQWSLERAPIEACRDASLRIAVFRSACGHARRRLARRPRGRSLSRPAAHWYSTAPAIRSAAIMRPVRPDVQGRPHGAARRARGRLRGPLSHGATGQDPAGIAGGHRARWPRRWLHGDGQPGGADRRATAAGRHPGQFHGTRRRPGADRLETDARHCGSGLRFHLQRHGQPDVARPVPGDEVQRAQPAEPRMVQGAPAGRDRRLPGGPATSARRPGIGPGGAGPRSGRPPPGLRGAARGRAGPGRGPAARGRSLHRAGARFRTALPDPARLERRGTRLAHRTGSPQDPDRPASGPRGPGPDRTRARPLSHVCAGRAGWPRCSRSWPGAARRVPSSRPRSATRPVLGPSRSGAAPAPRSSRD